jgi:hypothetical protein
MEEPVVQNDGPIGTPDEQLEQYKVRGLVPEGLEWSLTSPQSIDPGHQHTASSIPGIVVSSLIDRTTGSASSVAFFDISGLDLDTDLHYKIMLWIKPDASTNLVMRVNNNNTDTDYTGVNSIDGAASAGADATGMRVGAGTNSGTHYIYLEIDVTKFASGEPTLMSWRSVESKADATTSIYEGGGLFDLTDNVTSIRFADTSGGGANWEYAYKVYKLS